MYLTCLVRITADTGYTLQPEIKRFKLISSILITIGQTSFLQVRYDETTQTAVYMEADFIFQR